MKNKGLTKITKPISSAAALLVLAFALFFSIVAPVSAAPLHDESPAGMPGLTLQEFAAQLSAAPQGKPAGLYVADTLALPIVQQPAGQPGFVSSQAGVTTQFGMAEKYGTTGLLAHNTLAGAEFSKLETGQFAALVYNNGETRYYRIIAIDRYIAIEPGSAYSDFLDSDSNRITAAELFKRVYQNGDDRLVLQTCIANDGIASWGRLFITAEPVTEQVVAALTQAAGAVQMTSLSMPLAK